MAIPDFRDNGCLPMGTHPASEVEVAERFGRSNARRVQLMERVSKWLAEARAVNASRFVVNGSFVTAKEVPGDVDCVVFLPKDFPSQYRWGKIEAVRLYNAIAARSPKEIFAAFDEEEWQNWLYFLGGTRETGQRKGVVEVRL